MRRLTLGIAILTATQAGARNPALNATPTPDAARSSEQTPGSPRIGSIAPKTVDRHIVRELVDQAAARRIDIVSLGDSNQLFYAFGWQDGWTYALGARYPMFATPILGAGRNVGIGIRLGVVEHPVLFPAGAPAEWALYNDPTSGIDDTPYGFMHPSVKTRPGIDAGMRLLIGRPQWPENNFDASSALRVHFSYGVTPKELGAIFQPGAGQTLGEIVVHPPIDTGVGAYGIKSGLLDIPAGPRNPNELFFRWFFGGSEVSSGPFLALYMRFEDRLLDSGFSNHTLYWAGGASARQCAVDLLTASDEHLIGYFDTIRALQPAPKKILIRIAFGGNDRSDSLPSVGPEAGLASNTSKGVQDNLLAIMIRIKEIWNVAGWDQNELTFLLVGNHYKPVEPPGFGFRDAIAGLAKGEAGVAFVNLAELANPLELSKNEWYFGGGSHLTADGYRAIATREVAALLDLPEDLNGDCTVDTADLGFLLARFGESQLTEADRAADLNFDGLIDTADLGRLIANFGLMCPQ